MFSLNYEAPLKTAYLCCLYGVLPAANCTQVCTPNSCQTSDSPFAPCCPWPGVGTLGAAHTVQSLPMQMLVPKQFFLCDQTRSETQPTSTPATLRLLQDAPLPSAASKISLRITVFLPLLLPLWVPSLPPLPLCSLVGDGAQGAKLHELYHHY